jgi:hypothetical protein
MSNSPSWYVQLSVYHSIVCPAVLAIMPLCWRTCLLSRQCNLPPPPPARLWAGQGVLGDTHLGSVQGVVAGT